LTLVDSALPGRKLAASFFSTEVNLLAKGAISAATMIQKSSTNHLARLPAAKVRIELSVRMFDRSPSTLTAATDGVLIPTLALYMTCAIVHTPYDEDWFIGIGASEPILACRERAPSVG